MNLRFIVIAFTILLLAGCTTIGGESGSPSPTPTDTTTPTPSPTATPTDTAKSEPPDANPRTTVSFETLSDRQQAAFLDAVEGGKVRFGPDSPYVDLPYNESEAGAFQYSDYVVYEGRYYEVTLTTGYPLYESVDYELRAGTPGPNDTVVAFEDLTREERETVREAFEQAPYGTYRTEYGEPRPGVFRAHLDDYLRYEGETYRVEVGTIRDEPALVLNVTEYDS